MCDREGPGEEGIEALAESFLYSLKSIQEFTLIDSFLGKQVKLVLFNGAYEQRYCE